MESVERELLWLACQVSLTPAQQERVRALSQVDAAVLAAVCVQAGVLPSVYLNLSGLLGFDHTLVARLRESFLGHSLRAFQSIPRLGHLLSALRSSGIRALTLKGLAVSQQIYGSPVHRPVGDLDLLVPQDQAWAATGVLSELGYRQAYPDRLSDDQEKALIAYGEGRQFVHEQTGVDADLHWRTLDRWVDLRLPFDDLWERREILEMPDATLLPTLAREDSALILCLHGCQHGFESLKWLLDVARAAHTDPPIRWAEVRARAGHRRPMVDYALLMAHQLLASPLPRECDPSPAVRLLARETADRLRASHTPGGRVGLLDQAIATNLQPCLSTRGRLPGLLTRLATFACPSKEDIASVALPFRLRHLYYAIRLLHLGKKLLDRVG